MKVRTKQICFCSPPFHDRIDVAIVYAAKFGGKTAIHRATGTNEKRKIIVFLRFL